MPVAVPGAGGNGAGVVAGTGGNGGGCDAIGTSDAGGLIVCKSSSGASKKVQAVVVQSANAQVVIANFMVESQVSPNVDIIRFN